MGARVWRCEMAVSLEKVVGKDSQMLKAESRVSIAGLKRGLHFVENGEALHVFSRGMT